MANKKQENSENIELQDFSDESYLEYAPPDESQLVSSLMIALGESFGTGIFVFILCMGCTEGFQGQQVTHLQKCLAGGLGILSAVMISGQISGSHVNPAVTVSAIVMGETQLKRGLIYIVSQVAGATAGYAALSLATPANLLTDSHCVTTPSEELTIYQAFSVEIIITFILTLACCVIWDKKNKDKGDSVSVRLGLLVFVLALVAGPYTGASMNPARSIAPAIINTNFKNQWLYIVAPSIGGALSGLFYKKLILS